MPLVGQVKRTGPEQRCKVAVEYWKKNSKDRNKPVMLFSPMHEVKRTIPGLDLTSLQRGERTFIVQTPEKGASYI